MQTKLLVVTELFDISVNDFDANKSTGCLRMHIVIELVKSGIQGLLHSVQKLFDNA